VITNVAAHSLQEEDREEGEASIPCRPQLWQYNAIEARMGDLGEVLLRVRSACLDLDDNRFARPGGQDIEGTIGSITFTVHGNGEIARVARSRGMTMFATGLNCSLSRRHWAPIPRVRLQMVSVGQVANTRRADTDDAPSEAALFLQDKRFEGLSSAEAMMLDCVREELVKGLSHQIGCLGRPSIVLDTGSNEAIDDLRSDVLQELPVGVFPRISVNTR